ncbi:MAG TPA: VOC family protein [Candidatus Tectomicrobia bacterium]|jgi:catechol 2,3-dioxygenase-like lactoylglutathione lyase family enzyme
MFDKIQHIGYLVDDLDKAVAWFRKGFGAENAGGGPVQSSRAVPGGGRNAFMHFGQVEAELIEPGDTSSLPKDTLVMHHVGYVVADIPRAVERAQARGFKFIAEAPFTNPLGQQVLYFDPDTTNGVLIHLTRLPARPNTVGVGRGVQVDRIIHAGYLVRNAAEAVAWYIDKFDGVHVGGGASRRGGRNAFVNFGQVQVELIEPQDPGTMGEDHAMDHVGYVTLDIGTGITDCCSRGFQFVANAPNTNSIGQQVLYFDTNTSMGSRMHLTQLPA